MYKLNLVMSYPIKWNLYKVFRDYVQNFFDSVGSDSFHKSFHYQYDEENLSLRMFSDRTFDKEWLYYIGVSTKRESSGTYAGRFGEGFKIASLVAYRDHNLTIRMESADWAIVVSECMDVIDRCSVRCLAYEEEYREYHEDSVLTLGNITREGYKIFTAVLYDFFYPENPRFGSVIYSKNGMGVYELNSSTKSYRQGYLYVGYILRDRIELPLVIYNHGYIPKDDDRDRDHLRSDDVYKCVQEVIVNADFDAKFKILELMKPYWNGGNKKESRDFYENIIVYLVYELSRQKQYAERFMNIYGSEIIANFGQYLCPGRKRVAKAWFRNSQYYKEKRIVLNCFERFGLLDIEGLCEAEGGFEVLSYPTELEKQYIGILHDSAVKFFSDIIQYDIIPSCRVITNYAAPADGLAHLTLFKGSKTNEFGLTVRYEVNNVYIKKSILKHGCYGDALSVYLHELLHQYGGDSSMQFHKSIIMMNRRLIEVADCINPFAEAWNKINDGENVEI